VRRRFFAPHAPRAARAPRGKVAPRARFRVDTGDMVDIKQAMFIFLARSNWRGATMIVTASRPSREGRPASGGVAAAEACRVPVCVPAISRC
jgi:hypothetical protein